MKALRALIAALFVLFPACGSSVTDIFPSSSVNPGVALPSISGANVLPVTVNGTLCSNGSYSNKPCVSVTICNPGSATCQTISDILLDTGSYGLRVFSSAISGLTLTQVTSGATSVAECAHFGDGSSDWGPVMMADVILGNESAVAVPIQVINSTYFAGDYACGTDPDASPTSAGFNGILGIGLLQYDCGSGCLSASNNRYFGCASGVCNSIALAESDQVQNPIALLGTDNNGEIIKMPSVPTGGVAYADGYMILGIGTESNNTVATGVTKYSASPTTGDFQTTYSGNTYTAFLDTGSNGLFFPSNIAQCSSQASGFYCPNSTEQLSATIVSYFGTQDSVSFQVGNMINLLNSGNSVFVESGGPDGTNLSGDFDWGMPFFFGRNVYVGIDGTSASTLGAGPYWAY